MAEMNVGNLVAGLTMDTSGFAKVSRMRQTDSTTSRKTSGLQRHLSSA